MYELRRSDMDGTPACGRTLCYRVYRKFLDDIWRVVMWKCKCSIDTIEISCIICNLGKHKQNEKKGTNKNEK